MTLSPTFLTDLERVYSAGGVDLSDLAARLDAWRAAANDRLAQELDHLPPGDPLRCPVGLFGPLDYGRLETAQTRALAWFLDPGREHGFGHRLLGAFLRLACPTADWTVVTADRVEGEWLIEIRDVDTTNRLDVYAHGRFDRSGRRWVLAVEAKIDAAEGWEQLDRYDTWLQRTHGGSGDAEIVKVFLTPNGHTAETGDGSWKPVSFTSLAATFRREWANAPTGSEADYLRYYVAGLMKQICREPIPVRAGGFDPFGGLDLLTRYDAIPPRGGRP